jgi:uncharacterized protein (DUF885 family)
VTVSPDERFAALAHQTLDDLLGYQPTLATALGEHRHDDRLDDCRPAALDAERRMLASHLTALTELDRSGLDRVNAIDAELLTARVEERIFELDQLREHEWNPLVANPGTALYLLLAREFAPLPDRLRSLGGRMAAVPDALAAARSALGAMPRVHVETAISQFEGTRNLLVGDLEEALTKDETLRREVVPARQAALEAIDEHVAWLRDRLAAIDSGREPGRDPRIGSELYIAKLAHRLDAASDADAILARAEADLERVTAEIGEVAARLSGVPAGSGSPELVRQILDELANEHPDNDTIVGLARDTLAKTTEFVREHDLVTVYDDPVEIIVMPEIHRGVAVAYCDPPGPLETAALPTFYAISPTPSEWPSDRVTSFFREYNNHMIHNLTVHEAMPGHVLQLGHSRRFRAPTQVRAAFWSGPFSEGWAVYAEELMAAAGYGGDPVRMQQLKLQLRMIINTILDARVHAYGMPESEAMALMTGRGHQEEGEAVGKWRRALLTSAQLSTYYVGYTELADLATELAAAHPDLSMRERHDAMLAHGSPAPRQLRTLLDL